MSPPWAIRRAAYTGDGFATSSGKSPTTLAHATVWASPPRMSRRVAAATAPSAFATADGNSSASTIEALLASTSVGVDPVSELDRRRERLDLDRVDPARHPARRLGDRDGVLLDRLHHVEGGPRRVEEAAARRSRRGAGRGARASPRYGRCAGGWR